MNLKYNDFFPHSIHQNISLSVNWQKTQYFSKNRHLVAVLRRKELDTSSQWVVYKIYNPNTTDYIHAKDEGNNKNSCAII